MELQPNKFRYSLQVGAEVYILPNAPAGWIEENEIKWSRSPVYYGMLRTFSVPLQFVLDGAWLLRREYYTLGLRSDVIFLIDELNPNTWAYENKYIGSVDFSTYDDGINEVTVTVQEAGLSAQIKAYENVKYTIPLNVPQAIDVNLTPLKLKENAIFLFTPGISYPITLNNQVLFDLTLIQNEVQSRDISSHEVPFQSLGPPVPVLTNNNGWFFKANADGTFNVKGKVTGQNFMVYIRDVNYNIIETIGGSVSGAPFDIDFDYDIPVTIGDKLFLTGTTFTVGGGPLITGAEFTTEYFTQTPPSMCKAIRGSYLYSQLLKKMNNGADVPIQSGLLQQWDSVVFTSGNSIRGEEIPTIITSFKDFFTSINAVFNAGFGIQGNKAVLEKKAYWFQSLSKTAKVGAIKVFNLEPYEPYIFNSLKIGYPDQQFSTIIDNNDEVNSTQYYSFPIVRIQKELDLVSIYRADPYGIEDTRITPRGSSNTNNDNSVFMIDIDPVPPPGETYYEPLRADGYISLSGVDAAETYYNYRLSPKSMLLRWGDFLHSILDKYDPFAIAFESGLKNTKMKVNYGAGNTVTENANVGISTLADKIFLPHLATILTKYPKDLSNLLQAFPTGYISFEFYENAMNGFVVDASAQLATNEEKELKLLLTPYNTLSNLIR